MPPMNSVLVADAQEVQEVQDAQEVQAARDTQDAQEVQAARDTQDAPIQARAIQARAPFRYQYLCRFQFRIQHPTLHDRYRRHITHPPLASGAMNTPTNAFLTAPTVATTATAGATNQSLVGQMVRARSHTN